MILVSVGDHQTLHLVHMIHQIGDVRDAKVNSQHIIIRESQTAVHHNNTVLVLEGSNVHTDLFQSSQGYNFQP